jgi:hypothetical protein
MTRFCRMIQFGPILRMSVRVCLKHWNPKFYGVSSFPHTQHDHLKFFPVYTQIF